MAVAHAGYLDLLLAAGRLKRLPRTGWVREGIHDPESVAEHSYRVALLALLLAERLEQPLDRDRLIRMALVHDLAEVITGDLVVQRGVVVDPRERHAKERAERAALVALVGALDDASSYLALFDELVERDTPEARLFWQLDKLEMALQALEYEREQGKDLGEFFASVEAALHEPLLRDLYALLLARRVL
ncbi:MAG: HD domain-containing protein [Chloroflexota bacterium]